MGKVAPTTLLFWKGGGAVSAFFQGGGNERTARYSLGFGGGESVAAWREGKGGGGGGGGGLGEIFESPFFLFRRGAFRKRRAREKGGNR